MPPGRMTALSQPVLEADGVLLRPWQPSDRDAVLAGYTDPDIRHWHCRSMTGDEARRWIGSWSRRWREETGAGWAVVEDTEVAGQISLRRLDFQDGLAEVSTGSCPSRAAAGSPRGRCRR